jgi:hypothetical protein
MKLKYLYSYKNLSNYSIIWSIGTVKDWLRYTKTTLYLSYNLHDQSFDLETPCNKDDYDAFDVYSKEYKDNCMRLNLK